MLPERFGVPEYSSLLDQINSQEIEEAMVSFYLALASPCLDTASSFGTTNTIAMSIN